MPRPVRWSAADPWLRSSGMGAADGAGRGGGGRPRSRAAFRPPPMPHPRRLRAFVCTRAKYIQRGTARCMRQAQAAGAERARSSCEMPRRRSEGEAASREQASRRDRPPACQRLALSCDPAFVRHAMAPPLSNGKEKAPLPVQCGCVDLDAENEVLPSPPTANAAPASGVVKPAWHGKAR